MTSIESKRDINENINNLVKVFLYFYKSNTIYQNNYDKFKSNEVDNQQSNGFKGNLIIFYSIFLI